MVDVITVAAGAVKVLAPFLPYILVLGQGVQKKVEDVIKDQGAAVLWDQAQKLWSKITGHTTDDAEVSDAARMVARNPENANRQEGLKEALAQLLEADPSLADEILTIMGGPAGLNEITVGQNAKILENLQKLSSPGTNRITAGDNSEVRGNKQIQGP